VHYLVKPLRYQVTEKVSRIRMRYQETSETEAGAYRRPQTFNFKLMKSQIILFFLYMARIHDFRCFERFENLFFIFFFVLLTSLLFLSFFFPVIHFAYLFSSQSDISRIHLRLLFLFSPPLSLHRLLSCFSAPYPPFLFSLLCVLLLSSVCRSPLFCVSFSSLLCVVLLSSVCRSPLFCVSFSSLLCVVLLSSVCPPRREDPTETIQ
jgi:hypothetical protein